MARRMRTLGVVALGACLLAIAPRDGGAVTPPAGIPPSGSGIPLRDRPQSSSTTEETTRLAVISVDPTRPLGSNSPAREVSGLQAALNRLEGGAARIYLQPGHHDLIGIPYDDPTCGPCADANTPALATYGLRITGEGVELIGSSSDSVFIHTNAGYGILFEDCSNCALRGVTVIDGARDGDPNATDGGVVVRGGRVTIDSCAVSGNRGDSAMVATAGAGIAGIVGRDLSDLWIRNCHIAGNSSDGIALYRGARAFVRDNLIDGGSGPSGEAAGWGRGFGLLLRWNANAVIEGNLVTRYWKGIGVFEDARANVKQNVIEDIGLCGVEYSDGGAGGQPIADVRENAIYLTGGCGATFNRKDSEGKRPGSFEENAVVMTGQTDGAAMTDSTCRREALSIGSVPPRFDIEDNLFYANREAGGAAGRWDVSEAEFRKKVRDLVDRLEKRPAVASSRFMRSFAIP